MSLLSILAFVVGQRPLVAVIIITAAKEALTKSSIQIEKTILGGSWGCMVGSNKHRPFFEENTVHVQCETSKSKVIFFFLFLLLTTVYITYIKKH